MAQFIDRNRLEALHRQTHEQLNLSVDGHCESFALFKAMLCDLLTLDHISPNSPDRDEKAVQDKDKARPRAFALKAEVAHFTQQEMINQRVNAADVASLFLLRSLYSTPLSQFNDPMHVNTDVIQNMSYFAQVNFAKAKSAAHLQHESPTLLYDILQELDGAAVTANVTPDRAEQFVI